MEHFRRPFIRKAGERNPLVFVERNVFYRLGQREKVAVDALRADEYSGLAESVRSRGRHERTKMFFTHTVDNPKNPVIAEDNVTGGISKRWRESDVWHRLLPLPEDDPIHDPTNLIQQP
jgi:hypothetical protein